MGYSEEVDLFHEKKESDNMVGSMKSIVDDYHEHPELYHDCEYCSNEANYKEIDSNGSTLYMCVACYVDYKEW